MRIVNMTPGGPDPVTRPRKQAAGNRPAETTVAAVPADARPAAGEAITALYSSHYLSLVRLAALLVGDAGIAAEVVQDAFAATHRAWHRLRDPDKALSHLRRCVVHGSRPARRQAAAAGRATSGHAPGSPDAGQPAPTHLQRSPVLSALDILPPRQREALALRFYLDLPAEQAAAAMGISPGALRSHTARAMATLPSILPLDT